MTQWGIQRYVNLFRSQRHVHQQERSWFFGHPRQPHFSGSYTTFISLIAAVYPMAGVPAQSWRDKS